MTICSNVQKFSVNAEKAEVEQFYEDLQDLLELTPKKDVLFFIEDQNAKVGSQELPRVTGIMQLKMLYLKIINYTLSSTMEATHTAATWEIC